MTPTARFVAASFGLCGTALLGFAGCATQGGSPAPAHVATPPTYEGKCWLLGLEQAEAPEGTDQDSVSLVATYRFGEGAQPDGSPIALTFRVTRARLSELRAHLEAHPSVVCRREPGPSTERDAAVFSPEVPAFDGQRGQARR